MLCDESLTLVLNKKSTPIVRKAGLLPFQESKAPHGSCEWSCVEKAEHK